MLTEYANTHNQKCPECAVSLRTLDDYFGGGSHYWHLECPSCKSQYYFDTYRFVLEKAKNNPREGLGRCAAPDRHPGLGGNLVL